MPAVIFRVGNWSGWDSWKAYLSPKAQARAAAKKLLKTSWRHLDPENHNMIVETAAGSFRLVNRKGRVEPCETFNMHGRDGG